MNAVSEFYILERVIESKFCDFETKVQLYAICHYLKKNVENIQYEEDPILHLEESYYDQDAVGLASFQNLYANIFYQALGFESNTYDLDQRIISKNKMIECANVEFHSCKNFNMRMKLFHHKYMNERIHTYLIAVNKNIFFECPQYGNTLYLNEHTLSTSLFKLFPTENLFYVVKGDYRPPYESKIFNKQDIHPLYTHYTSITTFNREVSIDEILADSYLRTLYYASHQCHIFSPYYDTPFISSLKNVHSTTENLRKYWTTIDHVERKDRFIKAEIKTLQTYNAGVKDSKDITAKEYKELNSSLKAIKNCTIRTLRLITERKDVLERYEISSKVKKICESYEQSIRDNHIFDHVLNYQCEIPIEEPIAMDVSVRKPSRKRKRN